MAAKKRPPKIPQFQSSPFKSLKGFAVSDEEKGSPVKDPPAPPREVAEEVDFLAAMADLGVERTGPESNGETSGNRPVTPPVEMVAAEDEELFLREVGCFDKVFRDELPEEPADTSPRRMKQLRQGKLGVDAELDLHGLERVAARQRTLHFLENAVYQGFQTVRIITGQGHRSVDGPVLRETIERLLRDECPSQVLEWGRAPARQGGAGALILFLRRSK